MLVDNVVQFAAFCGRMQNFAVVGNFANFANPAMAVKNLEL